MLTKRLLPRGVFAVMVIVLAVGIATNGDSLEAVRVSLLAGAKEPVDAVVIGAGRAPDYRLDVRVGEKWQKGETFADTRVGDGLRFELHERAAMRDVRELRLVEDDKLDDDELERWPVDGDTLDGLAIEGEAYRFELETSYDLWVGFEWFFGTPIGMLVGVGIVIGVAVFVLTHLSLDPSA